MPRVPYLLNFIYGLLILLASPWLLYAAVFQGKYRRGYPQKLAGLVPVRTGAERCIWFHAVSVGEVNLIQPLLAAFECEYPEWRCVVSTTTRTGYELAKKKYDHLSVFYCPLDFTWAVKNAMSRVRPDVLLLAELELWPNLVRAARRHGARVVIANGRLSEHSHRGYMRIRWMVSHLLRQVDLIAAQNAEYEERFLKLGARPETVHVSGSLKFDGAETDRTNARTRQLAQLINISDDDTVFLAGSTQQPEEKIVLDVFAELQPRFSRLRLILAPRHPHRTAEVVELLEAQPIPWQRRSEIEGPVDSDVRILLIDTIGELSAWWGTASIAYVGGSMGSRGGQNMIEPAAYGAAVSFGPHTRNFRDIVQLMLEHGAACVVKDGDELRSFVRRCLEDPAWANGLGNRGQRLVMSQLGATDRTLQLLAAFLGKNGTANRLSKSA